MMRSSTSRPRAKRKLQQARRFAVDLDTASSGGPSLERVMTRVERLQPSTGHRYRSVKTLVADKGWLPVDDNQIGLDPDGKKNSKVLASEVMTDDKPTKKTGKKKRKRSIASRRPMVFWKNSWRDIYLDELLRWEGRGDAWRKGDTSCSDCLRRKVDPLLSGIYRCQDCFYPHLVCRDCCIHRHRMLPFHLIQQWTGTTFVATSLKDLGLRIQLNHLETMCSDPEPCHSNLIVLHTNGLHEVSIDYCGCQPVSRVRQLLRRGLYPSSQDNPWTCATFELLRHMHIISLTSKCSTYDFYRALEKLTNPSGVNIPRSKYRPLMRMITQWRHLKMLKRAGRGHDPTGAAGTSKGELAIQCPSCPHPGINIPDDWEKAGVGQRFLYFIILCMDANFRLKNQLVSNYSADPGLGNGLSYTISHEPYEAYVKSRANDDDDAESQEKGCPLHAIDQANTKYSKGLRYTGVSSLSCGRSEMIMPCSVGNLQKGEKYSNMDFSFGSALSFFAYTLLVVISYDAACRWFVNLHKRIEDLWPEEIKPPSNLSLVPVIPKLHEPGHSQTKNHEQFSCNLFKGIGATDCECPERIWSSHNALGNATKTMGPGTRHDLLDDHFSFWNYEKYISIGKTLDKRYRKAVPERNRQSEAHRGFSASIDDDDLQLWSQICEDWEASPFPKSKVKNPYHVEGLDLTQAQVRKELTDEEDHRVALGGVVYHQMSASAFLARGLELEDTQRRLSYVIKAKRKDATALAEERASLRKEVDKWRKIQAVYMPGLLQHLSDKEKKDPGSTADGDKAEELHLWLPSRFSEVDREAICVPRLAAAEERLRTAQCYDSLTGMRATLRLKNRMVLFKNKNVRGQRDGTRSRELINRVHDRAKKFAARYRSARAAKLALIGPGSWEDTLRVLRDADVRSYQDPERLRSRKRRRGTWEDGVGLAQMEMGCDGDENSDEDEEGSECGEGGEGREGGKGNEGGEGDEGGEGGEGNEDGSRINLLPEKRKKRDGTGRTRQTISWIWTTTPHAKDSEAAKDDCIVRAEWARSRARVNRATEEVALLREEMRRVLAFLEWKAGWWISKQNARLPQDAVLEEGLRAYSIDQASRQEALSKSFQQLWSIPLSDDSASGNDDEDSNDGPEDDGGTSEDEDGTDEGSLDEDETDEELEQDMEI